MKRRMEEAEAQTANLRAKMEEILQCPICLTVPGGIVVLQCHNGHIMCQGCANRTNTCPMCRIDLGPTQRYVKRLLQQIETFLDNLYILYTGSELNNDDL